MRYALLAVTLTATPAHAGDSFWTLVEGTYETRPRVENKIGMRIVQIKEGTYGASVHSAGNDHIGSVWAIGQLKGDDLILTANGTPDGRCKLTVRFVNKSKRTADIHEDDCNYLHGSGAPFAGRVYQIHD